MENKKIKAVSETFSEAAFFKIIELENTFCLQRKYMQITHGRRNNENDDFFERIYHLIYEACTNILNNLNHELGKAFMH